MFQAIQTRLAAVKRFDRVANSTEIEVGEVEKTGGGTALAIQLPSGEALTLEPRAQKQLLNQWGIPDDHFDKLPRELQAAELNHFRKADPKELTVRAIENGTAPFARSVLSGKYEAFDSSEAIEVAQGALVGDWEIAEDKVDRDEMRLLIVQPQTHDVRSRSKIVEPPSAHVVHKHDDGDLVKLGLSIRNSEIGTMALAVEFCAWRLVCSNGLIVQQAAVKVHQRHIWIDKTSFRIQLKNAIQNVAEIGQAVIAQMRASHDLALPNLNPEAGKLQREVMGVMRRANIATKKLVEEIEQALGREEEASLFGLVQYLTNRPAKHASDLSGRLAMERVAGQLMALARS